MTSSTFHSLSMVTILSTELVICTEARYSSYYNSSLLYVHRNYKHKVSSFPLLQEQYYLSLAQVNWTVAIPALGLSLGPNQWSSLAEIVGRRPVFILGTTMALPATIAAAIAPNYSGYMAVHFFQGLGVSPASNVGLAIINDIFFEHERGQKVGLWVLAIDVGLYFVLLIGGFVSLVGHQWIQWLSAIIFGAILLTEIAVAADTADEKTLPQSMVQGSSIVRRTKALPRVNITPLPGIKHPNPYDTIIRFGKTFKYAVVPISVMTYCFGWYWWVLSVVTLLPLAYGTYSPQSQGVLYIGLVVGTVASEMVCSGRLSDWLMVKLAKRSNNVKSPEMRIWLAYPAAILTAVGMIVWGVSVDQSHHWIVGQVALALCHLEVGAGIQIGNTAFCSYIFDAYPMQSMATMTFYAVMLNMSAFIDPFFIVPWVESVEFTWTFAGHAIITVFFCIPVFPVLAVVHRFGAFLRDRSEIPSWVNPEFSSGIEFSE